MPRPTIVIGLGGTGQWTLTFVKKDLLEINRDKMPDSVRLLAFDTMPQATAETAMATGGREKEVKVGAAKLDPETEYVHVGGNVFGLSQQVMSGKHPHIGSWFQAKEWLNTLGEGAFNLAAGSGQIRAFGRMAIYSDLMMPASSKVWTALTGAIKSIQNEVGDPTQGQGRFQLEIIIVASLAGGTGAGMFMDMALLARAAARATVQKNFIVRGFIALPRTFGMGSRAFASQEMQSRAYAAWRELDRFMINRTGFGMRRMPYHETWSAFNVDIDTSLFDVCYLIDPVRAAVPLNTIPPEQGVFPSIAAAISAIVDAQAGRQYTEHVTTNIQPARAMRPGIPLHSSMGTYTLKVPIYYNLQESAYAHGIEVLDYLLRPTKDKQTNAIIGLESAANEEKGAGKRGVAEVFNSFLGADTIRRGKGDSIESVRNTRLSHSIGDVVQKDGPANMAMVVEWAKGSLMDKGGKAQEILGTFTDLGDTTEMKKLRDDIESTLKANVMTRVPPSRLHGDTPPEAVIRFRNKITEFRDEHIGVELPNGSVAGGKFAEALDKCAQVHKQRFADLLRLWMLNTLMGAEGVEADAIRARSGKLGYAIDFGDGLGKALDTFLQFMEKVRQERTTLKLYQNAQDRRARAERLMVAASPRKILFWVHPRAHKTQELYLDAEQRLVDVRKDELLHDAVVKVVRAFRAVVTQSQLELERWKIALATGDAATQVVGLYQMAVNMEKGIGVSYQADLSIDQVQQLRGTLKYKTNPQYLADALKAVAWQVNSKDDKFTIECWMQLPDRVQELRADREQKEGKRAVEVNWTAFRELAQAPYAAVPTESKIAWIMAKDADGAQLADALYQKGEPLWMPSTGANFGAFTRSDYVRVNHHIDPEVRSKWEEARQKLEQKYQQGQGGVPVFLVESEDPHKCTVFRSDDMMTSNDFAAWHECREAYLQTVSQSTRKASLLYVFPAERNAAEYEQLRAQKLQVPYKEFGPKVVMILEDKARAKMCLMALTYGLVRSTADGAAYALTLDGRPPLMMTLPDDGNGRTDLFTIFDTFVLLGKNRDAKSTTTIDYRQVDQALNKAKQTVGQAQQNIEKLRSQIEKLGQDQTSPADLLGGLRLESNEEFQDLADLFRLMLLEEIEVFEKKKSLESANPAG